MSETIRKPSRHRFVIALVIAAFVVPFAAAWIALHAGWWPGTRSHGKPILPQRNFTGVRIVLGNGSNWLWRDPVAPRMTLVALSNGPCGAQCVKTLALLRNARITLNDKKDRLRLLYLGTPPTGATGKALAQSWYYGADVDGALAAFRPHAPGAVSALLVEANGTALVQYPAGFSPDGIKDDLHKVLR